MSVSSGPWFKLYTRDFLAGLADMSGDAKLIFTVLILLLYDNDGPIVLQVERLARRAGKSLDDTQAAIEELKRIGKIQITPEGLVSNGRAMIEIGLRQQLGKERSERGKKSISKRWNKPAKPDAIKDSAAIAPEQQSYSDEMPDIPDFLQKQKQKQKHNQTQNQKKT